ncbi:hypothetical protein L207DRAFT_449160 [Hyaloscypha variabilis F]|uniref:Uncharacterized protein n=1 Tax=Hyaloscypha variabilis (strain UAMH 11265 / GT02V1 / F) TaxID=1149755 RepID=A0A2J6S9L0_HYAVF|nr:hypothetical protein L207DRAFT_449160 [Hyaloscypha variabilis F]
MQLLLLSVFAATALAIPTLVQRVPAPENTNVNPAAITGTTCTDKSTTLVDHDINVALLSICGSIAGTIEQCAGNPTTTTGASGTAKFVLTAATSGQTIDITKGRWEGCVRAARAVCGDTPFTSTCIGGADVNAGNVDFTLSANS